MLARPDLQEQPVVLEPQEALGLQALPERPEPREVLDLRELQVKLDRRG